MHPKEAASGSFRRWGNGNGEVPPGQNVDEDGNIVNNGGHMPPGLNRRNKNKPDKDENPNPPEKPTDPGTEDSSDKNVNKAQQGTHIYTYDKLNQFVYRKDSQNQTYTHNGLFVRINNTQTSHSGSVYDRDYVIDYTSIERDNLMVYAEGNGQLNYVREDLQGNTQYYTKTNGNSFAELTYDAWGMPVSPNKLLNNDHGNYVYATYTSLFDTTLDIYFCEARFYDTKRCPEICWGCFDWKRKSS